MDETKKVADEGLPEQNFNENPDEEVPISSRHEIIRPIAPHQKIVSPNAIKNNLAHARKELASRKRKNKQARLARRKNRR